MLILYFYAFKKARKSTTFFNINLPSLKIFFFISFPKIVVSLQKYF